jgi:hypothetical protein
MFHLCIFYFIPLNPFLRERRGIEDNLIVKSLPPGGGI